MSSMIIVYRCTPDNKANALLPKQNWCLEIYIVIIERGEKMEEQTTIKTLFWYMVKSTF